MTMTTSTPHYNFNTDYNKIVETKETWSYFEELKTPLTWSNGSANKEFSVASRELPGVNTLVSYPCDCHEDIMKDMLDNVGNITPFPKQNKIWSIVQHLNDHHKWTREKIADWLDELHDSGQVNLEFEVETISDEEVKSTLDSWTDVGYTTDEGIEGGEQ